MNWFRLCPRRRRRLEVRARLRWRRIPGLTHAVVGSRGSTIRGKRITAVRFVIHTIRTKREMCNLRRPWRSRRESSLGLVGRRASPTACRRDGGRRPIAKPGRCTTSGARLRRGGNRKRDRRDEAGRWDAASLRVRKNARTWGTSATLETRPPMEVGTCETPEVSFLETVESRIIGVRIISLRMKILLKLAPSTTRGTSARQRSVGRTVCLGNNPTTTCFLLETRDPSERKVGFRWKPSDDDTVFSWKHANLREKSRVPVNFVARSSAATVTSTCARAHHQPPSAFRGLTIYPSPPCCAPFLCAHLLPFLPGLPTSSQLYARFSHHPAALVALVALALCAGGAADHNTPLTRGASNIGTAPAHPSLNITATARPRAQEAQGTEVFPRVSRKPSRVSS